MKIIGYQRSDFIAKDGGHVTGYNFYASYPAKGTDADGLIVERHYITDNKLSACGYALTVGDEVTLSYNRYGKLNAIRPVNS